MINAGDVCIITRKLYLFSDIKFVNGEYIGKNTVALILKSTVMEFYTSYLVLVNKRIGFINLRETDETLLRL